MRRYNVLVNNSQSIVPVCTKRVKNMLLQALAGAGVRQAEIFVQLLTNVGMRMKNQSYLGIARPTDVISVPFVENTPGKKVDFLAGDIYLAPLYILQDLNLATKFKQIRPNVDVEASLAPRLVHGLCHIMGYAHDTKDQLTLMRQREAELLQYISQTEKVDTVPLTGM